MTIDINATSISQHPLVIDSQPSNMAEPPSSPPSYENADDALAWYKTQYEQLEAELAEFRDSSRELEQELEKDIDRAEKQERVLQEKAETLGFEVEEWKVC